MSSFAREIRTALRALRRSPGFTFVSILTLALGIGASSSIFSVVNAVLLQPLPYQDAHELTAVWNAAPGFGFDLLMQSETTYTVYREFNDSFVDIGLYDQLTLNLIGDGDPIRVQASSATSPVFNVLGVPPARGRVLNESDDKFGSANVVVISDELWRSRYGSDPNVLGRSLNLQGETWEVVGIMPPGFTFPRENTQLWIPHRIDPATLGKTDFSYQSIARLKSGITLEAAKADLDRVLTRLPEFSPGELTAEALQQAEFASLVSPMLEDVVGDVGQTLWILLGTVGFILLIACANVANLFLVRAEGRRREAAVRFALGAGRRHMARYFLAEAAVMGVFGCVIGLSFAHLGVRALHVLNPDIPRLNEVGIDGFVVAFCAAVSIIAGLFFALIPMVKYGRLNLNAMLKDGGRGSSTGLQTQRIRSVLVVSQVALALVLLVGSGLMMRSFWQLRNVEPGFETEGVLTLRLSLPSSGYPDAQTTAGFYQQLLEKIEALPGVLSAGAVTNLPMADGESNWGLMIEDVVEQPGELPPLARVNYATPGYFEAIGIPVQNGRGFERYFNEQAVVVNSAFEQHYWPGQSALGKRVAEREGDRESAIWYTIVGVVGDVRDNGLSFEIPEMLYFPPVMQRADGTLKAGQTMSIAIRTASPAMDLAGSVRETVWAMDPHLPVANVQTTTEIVSFSTRRTTFAMLLLGVASSVALLLGVVGIYGVVSYLVSQRRQEIGVRMALGAQRGTVSRMVIRQGMWVTVVGVVIGLVGAWALTRLMASMLFGVSATDPLVYAGVSAIILGVSIVASYIPARRAARVSPVEALREG
ncbi:MAG: ABC transporter permease [bacterium]|nr:ABC transporter permease [bacterium]